MILVKTEAGHQALKDRSIPLSPRQRSAFILFDGKRSVDDVLAAGMGIVREDIDQMVGLGVLAPVAGSAAVFRRFGCAPEMEAPSLRSFSTGQPNLALSSRAKSRDLSCSLEITRVTARASAHKTLRHGRLCVRSE